MLGYEEYFEEPGAFDQEVESFKQSLRDSVKQEITKKIEKLTAENASKDEKLANLTALELAAEQKRNEYECMLSNVERDARQKVEREGIRKLLDVLAEPRYRLERTWQSGPKCGHCNEQRQLEYTTPRGKPATEQCECATTTLVYEVQEQLVHEMTKRNRELVVWYTSTAGFYSSNPDTISSGIVLKSAAEASDKDLMEDPVNYGYASKEEAQRIADALNAETKEKKGVDPWR